MNFEVFLDLLEPFEIFSAELKPSQVKRTWVDPDFMKKFRK
jgi:hypothetical protein